MDLGLVSTFCRQACAIFQTFFFTSSSLFYPLWSPQMTPELFQRLSEQKPALIAQPPEPPFFPDEKVFSLFQRYLQRAVAAAAIVRTLVSLPELEGATG